METLDAIARRRSTGRLVEPAPTAEQLQILLQAAERAPDHKKLRPWSFIVLAGDARRTIGDVLAESFPRDKPDATPEQLDKVRRKLERAPVVIAVATRRVETKLPFEELLASTAAAIQNILLAATDLGLGSMWRTGDPAYDPAVKRALGLSESDFISGFVYLGSIQEQSVSE